MISDIAIYDAAKHRLASGEEELVPVEVVDSILAGEHPVRAWRRHRGLTLERLAATAGLSQGYLSQIETGQRNGTVEKLKPIAEVLNLTLDDLT